MMLEILLALIILNNPACKAENKEFLKWSESAAVVESTAVPAGRVWLVRNGGLATDDGRGAMYAVEIVRPVRSQGDACCWRIPVAGMRWANTTPLLAFSSPIVLHEGEKLAGRSDRYHWYAIDFLYYDLPKECMP